MQATVRYLLKTIAQWPLKNAQQVPASEQRKRQSSLQYATLLKIPLPVTATVTIVAVIGRGV